MRLNPAQYGETHWTNKLDLSITVDEETLIATNSRVQRGKYFVPGSMCAVLSV